MRWRVEIFSEEMAANVPGGYMTTTPDDKAEAAETASRPASKQSGLWRDSTTQVIIKSGIICTECTEARAKRVVKLLRDKGWNAVYGGIGYGSIVPNDDDFKADFYEAVGRSYYV